MQIIPGTFVYISYGNASAMFKIICHQVINSGAYKIYGNDVPHTLYPRTYVRCHIVAFMRVTYCWKRWWMFLIWFSDCISLPCLSLSSSSFTQCWQRFVILFVSVIVFFVVGVDAAKFNVWRVWVFVCVELEHVWICVWCVIMCVFTYGAMWVNQSPHLSSLYHYWHPHEVLTCAKYVTT